MTGPPVARFEPPLSSRPSQYNRHQADQHSLSPLLSQRQWLRFQMQSYGSMNDLLASLILLEVKYQSKKGRKVNPATSEDMACRVYINPMLSPSCLSALQFSLFNFLPQPTCTADSYTFQLPSAIIVYPRSSESSFVFS
jgi:hypothetical protein